MLDIKYIRDNLAAVKANIRNRGLSADPDKAIRLQEERNALLHQLDNQRQARNENAKKMRGPMDKAARQALIAEGRDLKEAIAGDEARLAAVEAGLRLELERIPNMAHPDAPIGREEKDNLEISRSSSSGSGGSSGGSGGSSPPNFDFAPRDHIELATLLDIIDFERATAVSGSKFYYLKNEAVYLELALIRYAMDILRKEGFSILATPDIAREEVAAGIGFNPRGAESNIYTIEGTGTCLIGTAEITLGAYHAGETIPGAELPIRLAGISHCFRREAGAAGQFSKGLYRVHQFTKLEMFIYAHPEDSEKMLGELRRIEEAIFTGLGIPFRVVDTCTGDLGAPAYRKYDLEAWMPGRGAAGEWGEVTSASNCTDYQSRRLKVRYKDGAGAGGGRGFVHMLNGTAIAVPRAIISILENFQEADGSVRMPPVLHPYLGFEKMLPRPAVRGAGSVEAGSARTD